MIFLKLKIKLRSISEYVLFLQSIREKSKLELLVKVTGVPMPEVRWYRDSREITPSVKVKVIREEDVHRVVITNITLKQGGNYRAVARNPAGEAEHVAMVTVTGEMLRCNY